MKKDIFIFNHFKEYASFCLMKRFEEICEDYVLRLKELNSLQVLSHLNDEQIQQYFKERMQVFLKSAINDCALAEVEIITQNWKEGKLSWNINKYAVQPSDILLGFAARKNTLLNFLPCFTSDLQHGLSITKELNIFMLLLEERIFKAYIEIQQEVIQEKNEALNNANLALQKQISERTETEEKLRREKEFSDAVINNSIDGIFAFDTDLRITEWNKTLEKLNGRSKADVIGKNIFDLFPSYRTGDEGQAFKEVLEGKKCNLGDKPYSNQRGFYEAHMVPLLNEQNRITGGLSLIRDVTHRKISEDKIKQRENMLKEAQEIARLGSWEWIVRTKKFIWSEETFKIFGFEPFQVRPTRTLFYSLLFPEDVDGVKRLLEDSFQANASFYFEVKIKRKDNAIRYLLIKGKVLAYYNNVPYKMMGIAWDITERKVAEEELMKRNIELNEKNEELKKIESELTKTNNELEQRVQERTRQLSQINKELNIEIAERKSIEKALKNRNQELQRINEDLDNFVYTASHDLKAPMSNIEGLVISLNHELANASPESRVIIDMINQSIVKFKETITDLTEITKAQRNQEEDISLIDLHLLLEEIRFSIKDVISGSRAQIIYDGCDFPQIKFSKANLKSILYNLLTNAIKYKHPDRDPVIHIGCRKLGSFVVLHVQDNGLGISSNQKNKIFTMFKRLHDHVEGSGIGLYLVKRIVDNTGGKIEVQSEVGVGSTFRIFLKGK